MISWISTKSYWGWMRDCNQFRRGGFQEFTCWASCAACFVKKTRRCCLNAQFERSPFLPFHGRGWQEHPSRCPHTKHLRQVAMGQVLGAMCTVCLPLAVVTGRTAFDVLPIHFSPIHFYVYFYPRPPRFRGTAVNLYLVRTKTSGYSPEKKTITSVAAYSCD